MGHFGAKFASPKEKEREFISWTKIKQQQIP